MISFEDLQSRKYILIKAYNDDSQGSSPVFLYEFSEEDSETQRSFYCWIFLDQT